MSARRASLFALCAGLAVTSGCGGADPREEGDAPPTFAADIAPLLERSCLECHADASRGLPRLTRFADVAPRARALHALMASGRMPAGVLDREGCAPLAGRAAVTAADLERVQRWVDAGAPAGDDAVDAAPPAPRALRDDETVTLTTGARDNESERCFARTTTTGFLTGLDVRASDLGAVHHAMVFTVDPAEATRLRTREGIDGAAGAPCFGAPRGATLIGVWTQGQQPLVFPQGTGVAVEARDVVLQLHLSAGPPLDVTVAFQRDATVETPLRMRAFGHVAFSLAPGQAEVTRSLDFAAPGGAVWGVMPHLHARGTSLLLQTDGGDCVARVSRWRYAAQELAFFVAPLPGDEPLRITCSWDTRGATRPIGFGESSEDEMCMAFLLVAAE